MSIQIISTGSFLPKLSVSNDDLSTFLDTTNEWISTRSGIKSRHINTDETTSDLAINAAKIALDRSKLSPEDIELVICATLTANTCVPTTAANVKEGLKIQSAAAFDINVNCSGFAYAIIVAESMMKNCGYKNALIIGADTNSQIVDWTDRSTCVLFGDGAGAVVLSDTGNRGIISSHLNCIIDSEKFLSCNKKLDPTPFADNKVSGNTKVSMNGSQVMKFAARAFVESVNIVLKKANVDLNDIKLIIPHQANARIINFAAKEMRTDISKFFINIDKVGNTSSASVPIALDEAVQNNLITRGDLIIFVAFGGGLSSGAILLEW